MTRNWGRICNCHRGEGREPNCGRLVWCDDGGFQLFLLKTCQGSGDDVPRRAEVQVAQVRPWVS